MSKFFEVLRDRVKKIPSLIAKRLVHVSILGDSLEFALPPIKKSQTIKQFLEDLIIKVNDIIVYDANTFPFDFNVKPKPCSDMRVNKSIVLKNKFSFDPKVL